MKQSGRHYSMSAAAKELLAICLAVAAMFVLAVRSEAFQRFAAWDLAHNEWLLGEVVTILVLLAFAFSAFSWRRWRELRSEVTRRQAAEELLRKNTESYRQIVDEANEVIYRTNVQGHFTFCNPAGARLLNYSIPELLGLHFLEVIRPDHREAAAAFYNRQFLDRTHSTYYEFLVVAKDGQEVLLAQNVQLLIENDRIVGFQAVARDTTERNRSAEALRKLEEYRNLFQLANDAILILDATAGTVLDVNDRACESYGIARDHFIGSSLQDITQDPVGAERQLKRSRTEGKEFEVVHVRHDGSAINFLVKTSLIEYHGREAILSINRDITERKRVEEAARDSDENYHRIVEISPDAIIVHRDGIIDFVNNAAVKMIGANSKADLLGESVFCRVPPAYRELIAERIHKVKHGEFLAPVEVRLTRVDGSEIECELLSVQFKRRDHFAVQVIIRDITERKRAAREQDRLQAERDQLIEQLQLQMEFMPFAFVLTDANFRTTYWNPAAEKILGFTKEEVLGTYSHLVTVPPDSQAVVEEIFRRVATGESFSCLGDNVTRDGRRITCEWHNTPLKKVDGTFVGMMSMAQDVTEQRQTAQSLQEANQRALTDYVRLIERIATLGQTLGTARDLTIIFRALREFAVLSVPCDGMIISLYNEEQQTRRPAYCWADEKEFDPQDTGDVPVRNGSTGRAIKTMSVIIDNDFQQQMRTMRTPVVIGKSIEGMTPQSAMTAPMTVMGRTVGCVEIQSYQTGAYNQDHAAAMRMAANLAAYAVENVSLIGRELAKEEQLRQSQKMDAIGQLAGGVAHDFNNLLTVITGYSELSLIRMAKDDPLRTNIEEITKAGVRAAGLTRQLLAFSRRQMLQAKVLDLNTVVTEMDKMLQRLIGEDIDLVTLLKPALGHVKADPGQLEQVLLNLVVNARDAMPKGGKITIETTHTELDEAYAREHVAVRPGAYVVLSVSDTGSGMDPETQKRIFDPFFTTKEIGKGTGLGLSTVYGIVKQSEGSIWVYSELGRGTTFKVYLPRVDAIVEDEAANGSRDVGGSETILVVEDDELVRKLAVVILEQYGYSVLAGADGEEALQICKGFAGTIDLMLTDVVMPQMSGRELADQVAVLRPEVSVLYMSGYTDDAIVRHGILEDKMAFIQKPFLPEALARKTRELLDLRVLHTV